MHEYEFGYSYILNILILKTLNHQKLKNQIKKTKTKRI